MPSDKKRKVRDEESGVANTADATADISSSKKRRRDNSGGVVGEEGSKSKKSKKSTKSTEDKDKKSKKKRRAEQGDVEADVEMTAPAKGEGVAEVDGPSAVGAETLPEEAKSTKKKSKKDKKKASTTAITKDTTTTTTDPDANTEATTAAEGEEGKTEEADEAQGDAKKRFIVFVGNLPYSATPEQISAHFASVHPTSVRLLHQRNDPSKSRGVAFVEFARFDHMKTALKLYHHSVFRAPASNFSSSNAFGARGKKPGNYNNSKRGGGKNGKGGEGDDVPMEERKINVELTAGGGGNTEYRKEKIRAKNEKLNEQRARRAVEEARLKDKKAREKAAAAGGAEEEKEDGGHDIHPSRRHIHSLT